MVDGYRWRWGICSGCQLAGKNGRGCPPECRGKRPELGRRQGQTCVLVARGARNSCLIEFADGARFVTSRNGMQRVR